jgi:hypothetical protein
VTSPVDQLATISSHLADFELPRSRSVHQVETPAQITMQVSHRGTPEFSDTLLALGEVTLS